MPPPDARKADDFGKALEPIAPTSTTARLINASKAMVSPFTSYKSDSSKMLSELAPQLMKPEMITAASSSRPMTQKRVQPALRKSLHFATLGRAPNQMSLSGRRVTSRDLEIVEATSELLAAEIPESPGPAASDVSLFRGFNATIPSSERGKTRRRKTRTVDAPHVGFKRLAIDARGLVSDPSTSSESPSTLKAKGKARNGRPSLGASVVLSREELERQAQEIHVDKDNLKIRKTIIQSECMDIEEKISALKALRQKLDNELLKIQEDELELNDELEQIQDRLAVDNLKPKDKTVPASNTTLHSRGIRRKKGPAFFPAEHDELPPGVAFMTLSSHRGAITALDFSEPYGVLVSASANGAEEGGGARAWDLTNGEEIARLRGPEGNLEVVKCIHVEDNICVTGSSDSKVRVWDLRKVVENYREEDGVLVDWEDGHSRRTSVSDGEFVKRWDEGDFGMQVLEGHSQPVTALYFEDNTLITGASDKTLRQWDVSTGQCVLTMDILWAISHHTYTLDTPNSSSAFLSNSGAFSIPTPPYSDGTWDMYQDFVGGVQFWGYALVSGSGDSAVRMWDMRTGQAHRTLMGHTGPVTCLQFDEHHIISGSLDKTVRIWDLRGGGISETIRFDYPVTALQFDSRKILACAGENGVKVYNRTTLQSSTLMTNGHTRPSEKLRYMDRYMVSGGKDSAVKIWAI